MSGPPVDNPDALARALSSAWKNHGECINTETRFLDEGWRDLLEILIKSRLPEASEMASVLPLFRNWQQILVTPDLQLFPVRVSSAFRTAVMPLSLDLLSEMDGGIVQFLFRLGVTEASAVFE